MFLAKITSIFEYYFKNPPRNPTRLPHVSHLANING